MIRSCGDFVSVIRVRSLSKVDVIVDVVFAEAVIALAAGAVTELEIRVIGVGAAAYGALAGVTLVLGLGVSLLGGFFEIDHIWGALVFIAAEAVGDNISAENEVVEYGNNRYKGDEYLACHNGGNEAESKKSGVKISQPLYFDGDDKEEKHAVFGEEGGEYEEHGEVDVGRTHAEVTNVAYKTGYHAVDNCAQYAAKIVKRKLWCAPVPLKGIANEIVEIKGNRQGEQIGGFGDKDEGYQSPYLSSYDKLGIEQKIGNKISRSVHHGEQKYYYLSYYDEEHQVSDAESGVAIAKTVYSRS